LKEGRNVRVAITGREGQVVRALQERTPMYNAVVVAIGRPELDLRRPETVRASLRDAAPQVIVNAAAYTAVDQAEAEPEIATHINEGGARAVAEVAAEMGVPLVHLSTDYVFDGASDRPYRETDPVGPLGVYGRSKLAGEQAIAAATPNHVILRTAWVYSPFGRNFVKTMLRLAETRNEVAVVADQQGSPTSALDIADGLVAVCRNLLERPDDPALRGVFHVTGAGTATWASFASAIFEAAGSLGLPRASVRPIATADYPTPARRPLNSRLDGSKITALHGVRLPEWRSSLVECVRRLALDAHSAGATS
jgi:dTDP-4-dehydrorhamnose reductase